MQDDTPIIPPTDSDSLEKSAFILAEQGTLEIIELMGAADRLKSAGLKDQTIALYRLWLEHTMSPLAYVGYFNLGVELASEREYIQAEAVYRKAIELSPGFTRARLNLGNCLEQQKREDEALEQWRLALETESILLPENLPLQLHALNNMGRLFEMKKNYKDSLEKLEESFALDPTQRDVLLHLVHLIQKVCRWPVFVPPKGITKEEMISGTSPLAMLAASDDPKLQLAAAQQFIEHKYPKICADPLAPNGGYRHEKIRIGYLSSDFCLHAVSLLMVELLELHNHEQFEVYGFCWSRVDETSIQKRVQKSMDHYIKIGEMSDKEAADCIRSHEIDIMIDLQGLTSGARPLILSYRPAVLQMTYLGFPGTTGLPWIDYVIADKYLIPDELAPFHTEKPLYMPNCFQSSDSKREVGPMPTRADNGLPEKAFVFCSFNNNYKFTPEVFAAWMRIIKRVPGSVFWLLADNEWSQENLLNAAKKMGIKKDRLIFAPRVAPADYLARYQLADLFLDTFPFNGGTTANDALFMGLPLLTLSGRTFASRMAGSLLTNLGLPELIATNLKEYEEKAVRFAKKPAELKALKKRLMENKLSGPVFDLPQLVADYECKVTSVLRELEVKYAETDSKATTEAKRSLESVTKLSPAESDSKWELERPDNLVMKVRYSKLIDMNRELLDPQFSVLEIGSCSSGIAPFLNRPVTGLNMKTEGAPIELLTLFNGDMVSLDFPDNYFDYVVSLDILEHIAPEFRQKAISEMSRVARRKVIVSCPCGKIAVSFESRLSNNLHQKQRSIPGWLTDHIQQGLPEVSEILNIVHNLGLKSEVHGNESLIQHYGAFVLSQEFPEIDEAYRLQSIKSLYRPPLCDSGWDVYYSFMFCISAPLDTIPLLTSKIESEPSSAIYSCFHKKTDMSYLGDIKPIYSGVFADSAPPGALTDRLANSQGLLNTRWSELSAIYKIWKEGPRTDVVGFCHYRRFFNFAPEQRNGYHVKVNNSALPPDFATNIYSKSVMSSLSNGGIVTAKRLDLKENIFDQYCHNHNTNDWLWVINELSNNYPHLVGHALDQFNEFKLYGWNMFVTSWKYFDELCSFWFGILLKFEQAYPAARSTNYQNRDISFMAERVFDIWVRSKKVSGVEVTELPIYFIDFP